MVWIHRETLVRTFCRVVFVGILITIVVAFAGSGAFWLKRNRQPTFTVISSCWGPIGPTMNTRWGFGFGVVDSSFDNDFQPRESDVFKHLPSWSRANRIWQSMASPAGQPESVESLDISEFACGFPLKCFYGILIERSRILTALPIERESHGIVQTYLPYVGGMNLPVRPVIFPFVLDIAFWGIIVLVLQNSVIRLCSFRRQGRGRCGRCGYDLRGSGGLQMGCPECGWGRVEKEE